MHPHPAVPVPVEQLARAHGFSLEALAANRAGQIHPSQHKRGKKKGVGCAVVFFILSLLLFVGGIGGAIFLYSDLREPISQVDMNGVYALAGGGVVLSLCAFGAAIATVIGVVRRRGAYQQGALRVAAGPIAKICIRGSRGVPDTYGYDIGGHSFRFVPREGWELVQHGMQYRVYAVAGDLIAIEPA